MSRLDDLEHMSRAVELGASVRHLASPNPWVGCIVVASGGRFEGATEAPGGRHAEIVALEAAGVHARGATLYTTLEPCCHHGRTPPCTESIVAAGVSRVVYAMADPDIHVSGQGARSLAGAGIEVVAGVGETEVAMSLAPYLKHRTTGRPWVILKLAMSLDGRIAAPDGSSRWITGPESRVDVHRLRSESDAVLVGAGTIRTDDPSLTVRDWPRVAGSVPDAGEESAMADRQPLRVVLGTAPPDAKVHPAVELSGRLSEVLDDLGRRGVVQLLVEGGSRVATQFHAEGLVDRYMLYVAPVVFGGDDAVPAFAGEGASSMDDVWRGNIVSVARLGRDLRIEVSQLDGIEDQQAILDPKSGLGDGGSPDVDRFGDDSGDRAA